MNGERDIKFYETSTLYCEVLMGIHVRLRCPSFGFICRRELYKSWNRGFYSYGLTIDPTINKQLCKWTVPAKAVLIRKRREMNSVGPL